MKKSMILILSCFLIVSCTGAISKEDIQVAEEFCKDRMGIKKITSDAMYNTKYIYCVDGTTIRIQNSLKKKIKEKNNDN